MVEPIPSKTWHQGFSSTAQVLQAYLESSPLPSAIEDATSRTLKEDENIESAGTLEQLYFMPDSSKTTPRTSFSEASPIASPASSHTTYSAGSSSPMKADAVEIRRRRLPEGARLRVKNLALTKSNGATHLQPPVKETPPSTASSASNYNRSPAMNSPSNLPPAPAVKVVTQPSITRKPVLSYKGKRRSPSALTAIDMAFGNVGITYDRSPEIVQPIVQITSPQRSDLPPRTTSLIKPVQPGVGIRPRVGHKKNASITSVDKALPPKPSNDREDLPAHKEPFIDMMWSPPAESVITSPKQAVSQPRNRTGLRPDPISQATKPPVRGLPAGPKLGSSSAIPSRKPADISPTKITHTNTAIQGRKEEQRKPSLGPGLAALGAGPKPAAKHLVTASLPTLTSATVSGPMTPLPFGEYGSPIEEPQNMSRTRSADGLIASVLEPTNTTESLRKPRQASIRSDASSVSRSTTPQSQRSDSTAATSISLLPGVPEIRTPLLAPELNDSHFSCYSQHRPLVASSNHKSPILCMTCRTDAEMMWGCGWCHLRICAGCKDALVEVKNDLRRMLDESESGLLIIGKERIPNPPYIQSNRPRLGSDSTSVRSQGSTGMPQRNMGQQAYGPPQPRYLRPQQSMDSLQYRGYGYDRPPVGNRGTPPMRNGHFDYPGMPGPPMMNRQRLPERPVRRQPSSLPQSPNMGDFRPPPMNYPQPNYPRSGSPPNPSRRNPYQQLQPGYLQPPNDYPRSRSPPRQPYLRGPSPVNGGRAGRQPPPSRLQQQRFMPVDDAMNTAIPSALDLSMDAGAGPMALGMKAYNFKASGRGVNAQMDILAGIGMGGGGAYPAMPGKRG